MKRRIRVDLLNRHDERLALLHELVYLFDQPVRDVAEPSTRPVALTATKCAKSVKVGTKKFSLTAGQSVTVKIRLNKTGRELLARFRKLPFRVVATAKYGSKTATAKSRKYVIKARR